MGTVGIVTDLMRNFQTVRELKFAAQQAALYALSFSTDMTGAVSQSTVNIQNAVLTPTTALTNMAQIGPAQGNTFWSAPVTFASGDINFVQNPDDTSESFFQLTARRQGANALAQFFLPLLFTGLNTSLPQSIRTFDTAQTVELLSQPATRIGEGPPAGQSAGVRGADLYQYAALPLAITYTQFAAQAQQNLGASSFPGVLYIAGSNSTSPIPTGAIPSAFVNLTHINGGTTYYGGAQGNTAQLQNLLTYFLPASLAASATPPGMVECGSQLSAYDLADPSFTTNQPKIVNLVNSLPVRTYILPVITGDGTKPLLASSSAPNQLNAVVGFAYVQFPQTQNLTTAPFALNVTFLKSPPLRNVSSATGFASWPLGTNNFMPAPTANGPFVPRTYDFASTGVSPRYPGVAMAPALSPRPLNAQ